MDESAGFVINQVVQSDPDDEVTTFWRAKLGHLKAMNEIDSALKDALKAAMDRPKTRDG